ncbi:xaa-Pro dipeptidase-like [Lineus longissimus]|uniref:xaa-Pro dipeptidase-like n=1 Tax=Lineus longissimus TaxID=88925 RepID=UPI002B4ECB5F
MAPSTHVQLGDSFKVPLKLHQLNRERLCQRLKEKNVAAKSVVLLQGGEAANQYCSDRELLFRQESFFQWAFGVAEPDCFAAIQVDTGKAVLFVPKLPDAYAIWMGKLEEPSFFRDKYAVDECYYVTEMEEVLSKMAPSVLLTLNGKNTDSGSTCKEATFPGITKYKVDNKTLHPEIVECRVFKTDFELELLRYTHKISSEAHKAVAAALKTAKHEFELESIFQDYTYRKGGMRLLAYTGICAGGGNSSILHYGHAGAPNSAELKRDGLFLIDMGGEYHCYASDITTTVPVSGKFSEQQKKIYNAVLEANRNVFNAVKPGVNWVDMHKLAERTILTHLRTHGLVKGDIEEMMAVNLCAVFMPHGLGHFLGIDVHDVGGYPEGTERIDQPGLKSLRTVRDLQPRMCITIEPGCYFNDVVIDEALANPAKAKFLVAEEINKFRGMGGVRIEDCITVTETGAENFVDVPRTVEEIEQLMASG